MVRNRRLNQRRSALTVHPARLSPQQSAQPVRHSVALPVILQLPHGGTAMSRPSIVWITTDSVRADHTSLCGYQRETTPNLQTFANEDESQSFRRSFAHAIWSLPSVASILTGRYPSNHGPPLADRRAGTGQEPDSRPHVQQRRTDPRPAQAPRRLLRPRAGKERLDEHVDEPFHRPPGYIVQISGEQ